jgi:hypothetical protein
VVLRTLFSLLPSVPSNGRASNFGILERAGELDSTFHNAGFLSPSIAEHAYASRLFLWQHVTMNLEFAPLR